MFWHHNFDQFHSSEVTHPHESFVRWTLLSHFQWECSGGGSLQPEVRGGEWTRDLLVYSAISGAGLCTQPLSPTHSPETRVWRQLSLPEDLGERVKVEVSIVRFGKYAHPNDILLWCTRFANDNLQSTWRGFFFSNDLNTAVLLLTDENKSKLCYDPQKAKHWASLAP